MSVDKINLADLSPSEQDKVLKEVLSRSTQEFVHMVHRRDERTEAELIADINRALYIARRVALRTGQVQYDVQW